MSLKRRLLPKNILDYYIYIYCLEENLEKMRAYIFAVILSLKWSVLQMFYIHEYFFNCMRLKLWIQSDRRFGHNLRRSI